MIYKSNIRSLKYQYTEINTQRNVLIATADCAFASYSFQHDEKVSVLRSNDSNAKESMNYVNDDDDDD